ncbi:YaiO family outer membrane beta-barrel protein [Sabulibacter ruber]|uniref:YaiO family outer membrane beta-barrel protein n=1 Tax=Sabulibacter ruber TaxID=2811901 RepID=UPI001A95C67F|nr:YaiO family outer membrane beta-barrel protein [Sabulibacter ruber]
MSAFLSLFSNSLVPAFRKKFFRVLFTVTAFLVWFPALVHAQSLSPDDYFQQARRLAFEEKNYPAAIQNCRLALQQSPDYLDIRIFLGRLYYWNGQPDSSLVVLQEALQAKPEYEDAAIALADVFYFEQEFSKALTTSSQGLTFHPASRELALRKVKSLAALERTQEAFAFADSLLRVNPTDEQLRSFTNQLREFSYANRIGVSYEYTYFNKQFSNAWNMMNVDYGRKTKAGAFTGRVSYASRYARNGFQFEAEAYPRISKTFYAYTNIGFSPDLPVFPKFRAGFSLYANLPRAWEAEGGFRYLNFSSSTWVYTLSAGKYYRNFWFNARTYLTPRNSSVSQSCALTARYYLKGADDFFSLSLGRGVSPDDRMQANRLNSVYQLETYRIGAGYRFTLAKRHLISFVSTFERGEYMPETKGNQFNFSTGYQLRF